MDNKLKTIPEPKPNTRTVIETKACRQFSNSAKKEKAEI